MISTCSSRACRFGASCDGSSNSIATNGRKVEKSQIRKSTVFRAIRLSQLCRPGLDWLFPGNQSSRPRGTWARTWPDVPTTCRSTRKKFASAFVTKYLFTCTFGKSAESVGGGSFRKKPKRKPRHPERFCIDVAIPVATAAVHARQMGLCGTVSNV